MIAVPHPYRENRWRAALHRRRRDRGAAPLPGEPVESGAPYRRRAGHVRASGLLAPSDDGCVLCVRPLPAAAPGPGDARIGLRWADGDLGARVVAARAESAAGASTHRHARRPRRRRFRLPHRVGARRWRHPRTRRAGNGPVRPRRGAGAGAPGGGWRGSVPGERDIVRPLPASRGAPSQPSERAWGIGGTQRIGCGAAGSSGRRPAEGARWSGGLPASPRLAGNAPVGERFRSLDAAPGTPGWRRSDFRRSRPSSRAARRRGRLPGATEFLTKAKRLREFPASARVESEPLFADRRGPSGPGSSRLSRPSHRAGAGPRSPWRLRSRCAVSLFRA